MKTVNQTFLAALVIFLLLNPLQGQDGQWSVVSEMPVPVAGGQAVIKDSLILIIGGTAITTPNSSGEIINIVQVFDPQQNAWQILDGGMLAPRSGFVAGIYDNLLYSCGGVWEVSGGPFGFGLECWDFLADPLFLNFNLEFSRINTTGLVHQNKLYLIGGIPLAADSLQLSYIVEYDLAASAITYSGNIGFDAGSLPFQQMSARIGDDIYIFGGVRFGISRDVFKFSTIDHSLVELTPLNREIAGGAAVAVNDEEIYLIGGFNESPAEPALDSVLVYNVAPDNTNLKMGPQLNSHRWDLMAVNYHNSIYVFGGLSILGITLNTVEKLDNVTSLDAPQPVVAESFVLHQNFPNPFNPMTTIRYDVNAANYVRIDIYSAIGQHIKTLVNQKHAPGNYSVEWEGTDQSGTPVSSGIYMYRMHSGQFETVRKMIFLR